MRIINLSVDGIFQAAQRGLYEWLQEQDADIICLQDLQALEPELDADIFHPKGYHSYFFDSGEPHSKGVAIYTRILPKALIYGLGFSSGVDMQGRYLQIDFDKVSIGSLLAPGISGKGESPEIKRQFFDDLQSLLYKVTHKRRQFIICGNWQMAHTEKDVRFPDQAYDKSGFLDWEQQWLDQLFFQIGYVDAFRVAMTDDKQFSWWPERGTTAKQAVEADLAKLDQDTSQAFRTDFQAASYDLGRAVKGAGVYTGKMFSSHLPVMVEYDIEL